MLRIVAIVSADNCFPTNVREGAGRRARKSAKLVEAEKAAAEEMDIGEEEEEEDDDDVDDEEEDDDDDDEVIIGEETRRKRKITRPKRYTR